MPANQCNSSKLVKDRSEKVDYLLSLERLSSTTAADSLDVLILDDILDLQKTEDQLISKSDNLRFSSRSRSRSRTLGPDLGLDLVLRLTPRAGDQPCSQRSDWWRWRAPGPARERGLEICCLSSFSVVPFLGTCGEQNVTSDDRTLLTVTT